MAEVDLENITQNQTVDDCNNLMDEKQIDKNSLKEEEEEIDKNCVIYEKNQVCRLCLRLLENTDAFISIMADNLGLLLETCLPKLDLDLTDNPGLCSKCHVKLKDFHEFVTISMKHQEKLVEYKNNNSLALINLNDYLNHQLLVKSEQDHFPTTDHSDDDNFDVKSEDSSYTDEVKPKKKKIFSTDMLESSISCTICSQTFASKWALDRHSPIHRSVKKSGEPMLFCEICNVRFKFKHIFEKHVEAHAVGSPVNKPFSCHCGKFFNRLAKLKKHQENHVKKERNFGCQNCGKRFRDKEGLNKHVEKAHLIEKAYCCNLCGNKYTNKGGLDVHYKTHFPNEKPKSEPDLMCDICGKLFHRKYSLEKHRMSHTGDKPHMCDQCDMKFKERYQLTVHMRRHTGEKPYNCEVCGHRFPSKNRLGVHLRIHTGVRPFSCQLCDMAFTRNDHLVKHVRAIHTGERPFSCDICNKSFYRKDYLLKHKRVHTKQEIVQDL